MKLDEYALKGWPFEEWVVNQMFGEMVEGGADTTANHLLTLILALAAHPHVQERARKEIDAVCGTDRAPLLSDFDRCPYVNCIIKEGMRWRPTCVQSFETGWYMANDLQSSDRSSSFVDKR